jgi:hypothetical protein
MHTAPNVLKQGEYLLLFSLIGILNIAHELLTHEEVLNVKFDVNLVDEYMKRLNVDELMEYMKRDKSEYYPIAAIYYFMYRAYGEDDNDEYYFRLKKQVDENLHLFGREEKFNLLIILESICVNKISSGKAEFYKQLMNIYDFMLDQDLCTHTPKDYIQTNLFRNMFYTAMILNRFDWAEKFLEDNISKVNPEHRKNLFHFAMALLLFEEGRYEDALENISKVDQKFFVFKLDARILMLKIYYEMGAYESALSMIDSFTHFLTNNKSIYSYDKERFENFLKYLKLFIKVNLGGKYGHGMLTKEISSVTNIISAKWLLKKAQTLENTV